MEKGLLATVAAVSLFCSFSAMAADAPQTPTAAPAGVKLVTAEEVRSLMGSGAVVVDTRRASEFAEGTIKGAINVPYDPEKSAKAADFDPKQDKFDLSKLSDKSKPHVFFCNSGTCWKSYKASVVAAKEGYKSVNWYRGGLPDWKERKFPTE